MKIIREHVLIKVPSVFIDESRYKGVDGIKILLNVSFNPEQHIRCYGIVVSAPDELYKYPLLNEEISVPGYHDHPVWNWKTNEDIELEIQPGDKVYFHYNCLLPDQQGGSDQYNKLFMFCKSEVEDGKEVMYYYFRVKYDLIFAAVRYEKLNSVSKDFSWTMEKDLKPFQTFLQDKTSNHTEKIFSYTDRFDTLHTYKQKVVMIGSYVFVEPDMETWEDISIAIPETVGGKKILNPDGKTYKMKPKEQWLVTKKMPDEKYLRGWVRHVGSPLKGDAPFLEPGSYVWFQRFANTKVRFEGYDYFRMRQRHIFAVTSKPQQYA